MVSATLPVTFGVCPVTVLDSLEPGEWADPAKLEALRGTAIGFTVENGESKDLRIVRR